MTPQSIAYNDISSALAESAERFRQMAELTGEWLWEQDAQGYYSYSSIAVKQILGYEPGEVVGRHYTQLLTQHDKAEQHLYANSQQAFYGLTLNYRHRDGHAVYTESSGLPIIDANGNLLKWRGVDHDITQRKYYQDALIESEQRTRLVIEHSLSAIILMDANGIITDWNPCAEKIFGWTRQEALGQALCELIIPPHCCSEHRQNLQLFLATGTAPLIGRLTEQTALQRDGTEISVELSLTPLTVAGHYIFSCFINDITARKKAEQQIRQAQIELAISQREIKIAQQIQAILLPSAPLQCEALQIAGVCLPADKVGGDYFDYFFRDKDHLDMVMADVSGHSIGPALFMMETRSAIHTQANLSRTPAATLTQLNDFLFADLNNADFFITLCYLQYDLRNRQLNFANAGHPPPLLLRAGHSKCCQLDAEGLILGVRQQVWFEEKAVFLQTGDIVLIYTDGLTEAENSQGQFYGQMRLPAILAGQAKGSPQQVIDAVLADLKAFCGRDSFNDDITLMVFKCG